MFLFFVLIRGDLPDAAFNRADRTDRPAFSAADAFAAGDLFADIERHRADRITFAAADAPRPIDLHLIQREPVEQRINRPQRAQIPAEAPAETPAE